jgi:hypothetical protein
VATLGAGREIVFNVLSMASRAMSASLWASLTVRPVVGIGGRTGS